MRVDAARRILGVQLARNPANEHARAIESEHRRLKGILDETTQLLREAEALIEKNKKPNK
jgi:hypothetical protein